MKENGEQFVMKDGTSMMGQLCVISLVINKP